MSGRVIRSLDVPIAGAGTTHVSIPLDAAPLAALAAQGSALVSFETPSDEVQAFALGLARASVTLEQSSSASAPGASVTLKATVPPSASPFPGTPTGQVQFTVDDTAIGSPVAIDASGHASLDTTALPLGLHHVRAVYLGDADYAQVTSAPVDHSVVNAYLQLAPLAANPPAGGTQKLTITVNAVAGTIDAGAHTATASIASGPGSFVGSAACTYTGGSASASCTVTLTSMDVGTTVVSATSAVPVGGATVTRTTGTTDNTGAGGSGNASLTWKGVAEQLADLSDLIDSYNLQNGKSNKFDNTVQTIAAFYASGQTKQVCQQLDSLVRKAQQQSGKSLTPAQSDEVIESAKRISTLVGC
jgi:hypothetical protein